MAYENLNKEQVIAELTKRDKLLKNPKLTANSIAFLNKEKKQLVDRLNVILKEETATKKKGSKSSKSINKPSSQSITDSVNYTSEEVSEPSSIGKYLKIGAVLLILGGIGFFIYKKKWMKRK